MTDNELILAISTMMDKKIKPLTHRMDTIETKIDSVQASLDAKIDSVQASLDAKIDSVQASLQNEIHGIHLTLENVFLPRLNEVESCYTSTYTRYKEGVEQIEQLQVDMSVVKNVLIEHGKQLQHIS